MFSNKQIRCHIDDRTDQVEQGKEFLEYLNGGTASLEEAVKTAQKALADHKLEIANKEQFIKDVEATLHIRWLENPPY